MLIFAPGELEKTISILAYGDRIVEPDELFYVELSDPVGAAINSGWGTGYILDDEPWVSMSGSATVVEGNSGTTEVSFTVTLSAESDAPITVDYATNAWGSATPGVDYQALADTLTFNPGETSQTITVLVNGDTVAEYTE
jgi:chitinase